MFYKEAVCPVCQGRGFTSTFDDCSVSACGCAECHNGTVVVPITNGDLIRRCTNEQLQKVLSNLDKWALYSGGEHNRLLLSTDEDMLVWINKNTDDTDMESIFDLMNKADFEHPWLKAADLK